MNELLAGTRLQLRLFRRNPGHLMVFTTIPFFSAIFLSSLNVADRADLAPYAVIAPTLMALWLVSLDLAGSVIDDDREQGRLQLFTASPANLPLMLTGRVVVVSLAGLLAFVEAALTARVFFGVSLPTAHPWHILLTLLATVLATAGTATVMAGVFVTARSALRFANALGYPFYVLGGVLVPVTFLPVWIKPVSWFVYLYWSANLLRSATDPAPVEDFGPRLGVLCLLGSVSFSLGFFVVNRFMHRARAHGITEAA
ncbi:ABC transporter permease [Streptomyces sp. GZWMJZ-114]|uniref:ABC transporter permease n=1 Tax=Streptomyces sp. GZWMJZ-114 TaxID=2494734 RepID=UPI0010117C32|nr:ABC transporter permease [Streptomyces sp. GZWMJZ-114]